MTDALDVSGQVAAGIAFEETATRSAVRIGCGSVERRDKAL